MLGWQGKKYLVQISSTPHPEEEEGRQITWEAASSSTNSPIARHRAVRIQRRTAAHCTNVKLLGKTLFDREVRALKHLCKCL